MYNWNDVENFAKQQGYTVSKTKIDDTEDYLYHWVSDRVPSISGTVKNPDKIIHEIYNNIIFGRIKKE